MSEAPGTPPHTKQRPVPLGAPPPVKTPDTPNGTRKRCGVLGGGRGGEVESSVGRRGTDTALTERKMML